MKTVLHRLDANRSSVPNTGNIPVTLYANEAVPVQRAALDELGGLLEVQETVERHYRANPDAFTSVPEVQRVAITPDFHKGSGIPIGTVLQTKGFVVPQAIGSDINCGMRLHTTGLTEEAVLSNLDALERKLRRVFFEAGRSIPMTRAQREALLTAGLEGLCDAVPRAQQTGLWAHWHRQDWVRDLARTEERGSLSAGLSAGFDDWLGQADAFTRDAQIGSIGGGNHFVEIQRVERILDRSVAHAWGLRVGMVTIMVHTGSLGLGSQSAGLIRQMLRGAHPENLPHPSNGIYLLPLRDDQRTHTFWNALGNAANFAFANRAMLALMAWQCLEETITETEFPLLYDAPHNLVWQSGETMLHRKGATPARGLEEMQDTAFAYTGEPVLVPGSMGASSYVMAGMGNPEALSSASHGAGRAVSRRQAARGHDAEFERFLQEFRIVTALNWRHARGDIKTRKLEELKQEAPHAYKNILPVVETLEGAGLARRVAELKPLLTVKG